MHTNWFSRKIFENIFFFESWKFSLNFDSEIIPLWLFVWLDLTAIFFQNRSSEVHRKPSPRRLCDHCGCCVTSWWWLCRSSHSSYAQHCSGILGLGQKVGSAQALSLSELAHQLQQVYESLGRLLWEEFCRVCTAENQSMFLRFGFELKKDRSILKRK